MSLRDRFANTTRALADALEAFADDDEGVKVCGVPRVPLPLYDSHPHLRVHLHVELWPFPSRINMLAT